MTSKPLHVRLEVMVDGERCKEACPGFGIGLLSGAGICKFSPSVGKQPGRMLYRDGTYLRTTACLNATTADALNAAVVEAAKDMVSFYVQHGVLQRDEGFTLKLRAVVRAVDALRSAERKEKR